MTAKEIVLKSGTKIIKTQMGDYDEAWDIKWKAVATTIVTLDLTDCVEWEVAGYEDETSITEIWEPMENRRLFYTIK